MKRILLAKANKMKSQNNKKEKKELQTQRDFLEEHQIYILRNAEMSKNLRANLGKFYFVVVCGSI